ncbi:MAG TPA: hypothetical protein VHJ40_01815 [Actinomycetota bacterium]|nr:hypothetical protein [Actinomycetota bacterium]
MHATEAAEPDEEQAEDIAEAPPADEEEVAADLQPLRVAGGGVHVEVRWHGAGAGAGAQTTGNQEGPKPANIGAAAQATAVGPAKDAADRTCWDWILDCDVAAAGPDTVVAPRAATASIIFAVRAKRPVL